MDTHQSFDAVVVGGGPAGATAATDLARRGWSVALLDRAGRIKPCGGAIPPRLIRDFDIPENLLVAKVNAARVLSPQSRHVDMPINGFVGMVDREVFDEWLRGRAAMVGAKRVTGTFVGLSRQTDGTVTVTYRPKGGRPTDSVRQLAARSVIGADGANSAVAREALPGIACKKFVFAYHEVVRAPNAETDSYDGRRCDVYYQGPVSPDFYGWVFPHGTTASVGTGTAHKGFSLKQSVDGLRRKTGLDQVETLRREGAPIPLRPLRRWDNRRDVVLVGDAAGVVAPASGEGIYYAMASARFAADAVDSFLATGDVRALATARRKFMRAHGKVFWILGMMQRFWYASDRRRERFVSICADPDVQQLTWDAYMNKELIRRKPIAHARIFFKDLGHLFGVVSPWAK